MGFVSNLWRIKWATRVTIHHFEQPHTSSAFTLSETLLSQYIDNIVHYIMTISHLQYCEQIVTILSTTLSTSTIRLRYTLTVYDHSMVKGLHIVTTYVNIYINRIVAVYNIVGGIFTICWHCEFFTTWWTILSTHCDNIVAQNAKAGDVSCQWTVYTKELCLIRSINGTLWRPNLIL